MATDSFLSAMTDLRGHIVFLFAKKSLNYWLFCLPSENGRRSVTSFPPLFGSHAMKKTQFGDHVASARRGRLLRCRTTLTGATWMKESFARSVPKPSLEMTRNAQDHAVDKSTLPHGEMDEHGASDGAKRGAVTTLSTEITPEAARSRKMPLELAEYITCSPIKRTGTSSSRSVPRWMVTHGVLLRGRREDRVTRNCPAWSVCVLSCVTRRRGRPWPTSALWTMHAAICATQLEWWANACSQTFCLGIRCRRDCFESQRRFR